MLHSVTRSDWSSRKSLSQNFRILTKLNVALYIETLSSDIHFISFEPYVVIMWSDVASSVLSTKHCWTAKSSATSAAKHVQEKGNFSFSNSWMHPNISTNSILLQDLLMNLSVWLSHRLNRILQFSNCLTCLYFFECLLTTSCDENQKKKPYKRRGDQPVLIKNKKWMYGTLVLAEIMHNIASLHHRFPAALWLPYDWCLTCYRNKHQHQHQSSNRGNLRCHTVTMS